MVFSSPPPVTGAAEAAEREEEEEEQQLSPEMPYLGPPATLGMPPAGESECNSTVTVHLTRYRSI